MYDIFCQEIFLFKPAQILFNRPGSDDVDLRFQIGLADDLHGVGDGH